MNERLEETVIAEGLRIRATDIHIDPLLDAFLVRMRVDGTLHVWKSLTRDEGTRLINQFKADSGIEPGTIFHPIGQRRKAVVGDRCVDLRVSLVPCISGPKMAIRILDPARVQKHLPTLGMCASDSTHLESWLKELNGMLLVTGPTGSGKTTTAYALLHELVEESSHVVTIEDPVEYEIDGINQMQVDHRHGLSFSEGVKTSLRLDPDCLMVGEIRDAETAQQAINASVQGHVVIATLHSRDAISAITRLRNFQLENHQIAAGVGIIVNQRLAGKLCSNCVSKRPPTRAEIAFLTDHSLPIPSETRISDGCSDCNFTGTLGRTGVFEVWNLDQADYEMVLAGADEESLREKLQAAHQKSLLDDAVGKIESGVISVEEATRLGLNLQWSCK